MPINVSIVEDTKDIHEWLAALINGSKNRKFSNVKALL